MVKTFTFEEMGMTLEMIRDWNTISNWESIRSKIITERDNLFLVEAVYEVTDVIDAYISDSIHAFGNKESDYEDLMMYLRSLFRYNLDYTNVNEPIQIFKTAWFYTTNTLFGE